MKDFLGGLPEMDRHGIDGETVVPLLDDRLVLFDVILPFAFGPDKITSRDWQ
jgi:hypothetical protein